MQFLKTIAVIWSFKVRKVVAISKVCIMMSFLVVFLDIFVTHFIFELCEWHDQ